MSAAQAVNIVSTGHLAEGHSPEQVAKQLARSFSIDEQQARQLLNAGRILKKSVKPDVAKKYQAALYKMGLKAAIKEGKKAPVKTLPTGPITGDELRQLFDTDFDRPRASTAQIAGLSGAAIGSLLAPALYALLVLFGGYWLVQMLAAMAGIGVDTGFNPSLFAALLVPTLVLAGLLVLLLKPLIAPRKQQPLAPLERARAPLFYDLVQVICRRLHAPAPVQVQIHNDVDISVTSAGALKALRKGELRLRIGLPLLATLDTRQLAALLTHEFGHHTNANASQAYILINAISRLLHRAAHEDDQWDLSLQRLAADAGWPATVHHGIGAVQWLVDKSRQLFNALFKLHQRITGDVSRQMEYSADFYSSQVSGSQNARKDAVHLRAAAYAFHLVNDLNQQALNQGKLLRDIPAATQWQLRQFGRKTLLKLEEGMNRTVTESWHFHPADNDRLELVEGESIESRYKLDFPAAATIGHFPELSATLTRQTYEAEGIEQARQLIVDNEKVLSTQEALGKAKAHLAAYFSGSFTDTRLMWLLPPQRQELLGQSLEFYIDWLRKNLMDYREQQAAWDEWQDDLQEMTLGRAYIAAGVAIEPRDFQLPKTGRDDIDRAFTKIHGDIDTAMHKLQQVDQIFYCRIGAAIDTMPGKEQIRSRRLLDTLHNIANLRDKFQALRMHRYVLEALNDNDEPIRGQTNSQLQKVTKECMQTIATIYKVTQKIPDRINKNDGSLKNFLLQWAGAKDDNIKKLTPAQLAVLADNIEQALLYQYQWIAGELAAMCTREEQRRNIQGLKLVAIKDKKAG